VTACSSPRPGRAGRDPVLEGRRPAGRTSSARRSQGVTRARGAPGGQGAGRLTEEHSSTSRRRRTCSLSSTTSRRRPRRPLGPHCRRRALPRRDRRLARLHPDAFGARVHAPWSLALGARLRDALGLEVQSLWSDDGIAVHLPDATRLPHRRIDHRPGRDRGARHGRARRQPAVRLSLPRERGPRASDPTPTPPASARRSGSNGSRRRACSRSRASTARSASSSRPTASASRTSSTCLR